MIYGPLQSGSEYVGRGKDKFFLYQIVANKTNNIDVDKVMIITMKSRMYHSLEGAMII